MVVGKTAQIWDILEEPTGLTDELDAAGRERGESKPLGFGV